MALRKGFTTGTCSQAATRGAAVMFINQKMVKKVEVETPSGIKLELDLIDQEIRKDFARCGIIKDAGDDPDVTDGVKIYAEVRPSPQRGITIKGGEGVGRVTKPGLALPIGEYAINPTPRAMVFKEAAKVLSRDITSESSGLLSPQGLEVIISVPRGKELAKHTFNPRLGIVGGISILGTTGIVEPRSVDAYKTSLALQVDILKAAGHKKAMLVLGYVGERFCRAVLNLADDSIIRIGDHVGFMLEECVKKEIKEVFLIGYLGKLVKITEGQFNTHSRFGDNRIELIVHYARLQGAAKKIIQEISSQTTAEATIEILRKNGLEEVFDQIAREIVVRASQLVKGRLKITCLILSLEGEVLASYPEAKVKSG